MDRKDVERKIKALLKLSSSPYEEEAASAASKARELMDRYNLSRFDTKEKEDVIKNLFDKKTRHEMWTLILFRGVAEANDCFAYINTTSEMYKGNLTRMQNLTAVGHDEDLQLVEYAFTFLKSTIDTMFRINCAKEGKTRAYWGRKDSFLFKRSFCEGAVANIIARMNKAREDRLYGESQTKDLVVSRQVIVKNWVDKNLNMGKGKKRGNSINGAWYQQGYRQGEKVKLRSAIN